MLKCWWYAYMDCYLNHNLGISLRMDLWRYLNHNIYDFHRYNSFVLVLYEVLIIFVGCPKQLMMWCPVIISHGLLNGYLTLVGWVIHSSLKYWLPFKHHLLTLKLHKIKYMSISTNQWVHHEDTWMYKENYNTWRDNDIFKEGKTYMAVHTVGVPLVLLSNSL